MNEWWMKIKNEWIDYIWMNNEWKGNMNGLWMKSIYEWMMNLVYLGEYWMKRIYKRMMNEKDIWSNEWWMNYINKW